MHIDTYGNAIHTKMAGDMQRHISIHPIDPEQPDSPTGSARQHANLPNKPEGHANTPNMRRNAHGNVDGSNTPENESITPDSPVRGAVSRIGESEGIGSSMDAPDTCTYTQSTASDLRMPAHASEYFRIPRNVSKTPNSLGRSAEAHTGAREARKSLVCIGHAHARAQRSDRCKKKA